jgi:hypothetical protein
MFEALPPVSQQTSCGKRSQVNGLPLKMAMTVFSDDAIGALANDLVWRDPRPLAQLSDRGPEPCYPRGSQDQSASPCVRPVDSATNSNVLSRLSSVEAMK